MKKIFGVMLLIAAVMMTSCHIEHDHEGMDADSISVKKTAVIRLAGDVEISTAAMTRGNGMRYVALKVRQFELVAGDTLFRPYAEGVFTTDGPYRLTVDPSHRYKVDVAVVENGFDWLFADGDRLFEPFSSSGVSIGNQMSYTSDALVLGGMFRVKDGGAWKMKQYPELDYFRGSVVTEAGDGDITVAVKRQCIGMNFMISRPAGGVLTVSSPSPTFSYEVSSGMAYDTRYYAVPDGEQRVPVNFGIVWTDANGERHDYSQPTKFLPVGTMTRVKIDVSGHSSEASPSGGNIALTYSSGLSEGGEISIK